MVVSVDGVSISTMHDVRKVFDDIQLNKEYGDIIHLMISSNYIHSQASEIFLNDDRILPSDTSHTLNAYENRLTNPSYDDDIFDKMDINSLLLTNYLTSSGATIDHEFNPDSKFPGIICYKLTSLPSVDNDIIAHLDDGAHVSTTNNKNIFFSYSAFTSANPCKVRLIPVDKIWYTPTGIGTIRIPANTTNGYIVLPMYYTPELPTTIVSNDSIAGLFPAHALNSTSLQKDYNNNTFQFTLHHSSNTMKNIIICGTLIKGSCYTLPLHMPNACDTVDSSLCNNIVDHGIHKLDTEMERRLWHERLNHCSDFYLQNAHLSIDGVPRFNITCPVMDICPICVAAKMKNRPSAKSFEKTTHSPWEFLYIDCGFSGLTSKNDTTRATSYKGLSGETCYILIRDVHTSTIDGECFASKAIPGPWLDTWLKHHPCISANKRCILDQGGELFHNKKITNVLQLHGYEILPTGAGAHHQAGFVEQSHQSIGNGIRSILTGANLSPQFWPYAFHHYVKISNMLPQRVDNKPHPSSFEQPYKQKAPLQQLKTFGCRVWVKPPQRCLAKFQHNTRKGIFLGYLKHTNKSIYWYDVVSKRVKIAYHVRFDESMNDLPAIDLPPNVVYLQRVSGSDLSLLDDLVDTQVGPIEFYPNGFFTSHDNQVKNICTDKYFGFRFKMDSVALRPYISALLVHSSAAGLCSSHRATSRKYLGAFVIAIHDIPVYSIQDIHTEFKKLREAGTKIFSITLAPEPKPSASDNAQAIREHNMGNEEEKLENDDELPELLSLGVDELKHINKIRSKYINVSLSEHMDDDELSDNIIANTIASIQSSAATSEERLLPKYT